MPTVNRELTITYGSFSCGGTTDTLIQEYTSLYQGFEQSGVRFTVLVTGSSEATFASNCAAIETAFRTPRKNLTVSLGSSTLLSLSHSAGTGFNADPVIEKTGQVGDTGRSRFYTIKIDFGMPADTSSTSYRRSSQVRVTWSSDRRRHVAIDGVYTCNGSTASSAQYAAAIGAYASAILTALGGSYDLLEEHVENDDQDKVATFHRLYDEQLTNRNEATITVSYTPDRRRHVTIKGKYTEVESGTGAVATYTSSISAFVTSVLGAVGGTYDLQAETYDYDDADRVLTFSRTYDELLTGRKEAAYTVAYDPSRRRHVTFTGMYTTASAGTSALSAYNSNFPTWASGILTALGGTYEKVSEQVQPNDQDNAAQFQTVYDELIFTEAGSLPDTAIVQQKFRISRAKDAPGDTPTATRVVTLDIEYECSIDKTLSTDLQGKWNSIRSWLVNSIVPTYQAGTAAIVAEKPQFDPVQNIISATMQVDVATANMLLQKIEITDDVDQGEEFVGLWTGNPMDFYRFTGHVTAIRTIAKTYRRLQGGAAPAGGGGYTYSGPAPVTPPAGAGASGSVLNPSAPGISGSGGEGGDDPFGFGNYKAQVIRRTQSKTKLDVGISPNIMKVEDVVYTTVMRLYSTPVGATAQGVIFTL